MSPEFPNKKRQQRQSDIKDVKLDVTLLQPAQPPEPGADAREHGPVYFLGEGVGRFIFQCSVGREIAARRRNILDFCLPAARARSTLLASEALIITIND